MAGLLSDVLPWVYSQGDRAKRYMKGLLSDPVGSMVQGVNNANDRAGGLLAVTRAAAQEGALGNGPATQQLTNMLIDAYNPVGITVWHGSPHKFNKFDSGKIGTGEGAQAYGHGLYLAESPKVAESYSGKLSSELKYNGRPMNRESSRNSRDSAAWALYLADGDREAAKASGLAKPELIDALDPAKLKAGGQLYKVDLPDDAIAKMLDWDKPLSQQAPEVRAALEKAKYKPDAPDVTGSQVLMDLAFNHGGESAASNWLRAQGIPGVRYLDGGSRGQGGGTSNYVIFPGNEGLLSILERNGQPIR